MNLSELARRELEETNFLWEMKSTSRQEEEGVKEKKRRKKERKNFLEEEICILKD